MNLALLLLFLAASCSRPLLVDSETSHFLAAPATKQKQRIQLLEKKLESAEKEKQKALAHVEKLQGELNRAKLKMIQKQIDLYEEQLKKLPFDPQKYGPLLPKETSSLFLKEREMLHQMIQEGPSPSAFDAQVALDRILRMITTLSDDSAIR